MKHSLILLTLTLSISITLAACGGGDSTEPDTQSDPGTNQTQKPICDMNNWNMQYNCRMPTIPTSH